jgi:DNA integrity scanning protein DisA with diadenylate cyclase activity
VPWQSEIFDEVLNQAAWCSPEVFGAAVELAIEIAREGREGRRIGTLFTLGFHERVLALSHSLILDPLALHPKSVRNIRDPNLRECVKELAQLDGGFIVGDDGTFMAACRYFDTSSEGIEIGLGLGSRHLAAASISRQTGAFGIVVSESAVVRLYKAGNLSAEILPELWLLGRHGMLRKGSRSGLHPHEFFAVEDLNGG